MENNNIAKLTDNQARMVGVIASPIVFEHEIYGKEFYTFELVIERKNSSNEDRIAVTVAKELICDKNGEYKFNIGDKVKILGSIRSYDKCINGKNKLLIVLFANNIEDGSDLAFENIVHIRGYLVKDPVFRITPNNINVTDVFLAVKRYNKTDYLPCIVWNKAAVYVSKVFKVSDRIEFNCRLQSRIYVKTIGDKKLVKRAYELSVCGMVHKLENNNRNSNEKEIS